MKIIFIVFVFAYHIKIHNGLEKMLCETYFGFSNVMRPLEKCKHAAYEAVSCVGMPSGHAETATIVFALLYYSAYIPLYAAILGVLVVSAQRVYTNMHTWLQVVAGIAVGLVYAGIYMSLHMKFVSLFLVIGIGACIILLMMRQIDAEIHGPIPDWVDPAMLPDIQKKQGTPYYMEFASMYFIAATQETPFIRWSTLETYLDILVDRIRQTGIQYDAVVGIKTGGAIISDYVSQQLGLRNYKVKLKRSEYNCDKKQEHAVHDIVVKKLGTGEEEFTVCEGIDDDLRGQNVILIDECVASGVTMAKTIAYLLEDKRVNQVYPTCISLFESQYKEPYTIDYIIPIVVPIWPWGYDN